MKGSTLVKRRTSEKARCAAMRTETIMAERKGAEVNSERLHKLIAQQTAPGTRFLAAISSATKISTVAPITDNKGDINQAATLIKSIHSAGRMATKQHRSMKGK